MKHMIKSTVRDFALDRRGNVAMTFGLIAVSITGILGAATDFSNAHRVETIAQNVCDASAMSAVKAYGTGSDADEIEKVLRANLAAGLAGSGLTLQGEPEEGQPVQAPSGNQVQLVDFQFNEDDAIVSVTLRTNSPTGFLGILPFDMDSIEINIDCEAAQASSKKVELAIMLDTTGSMQGQKIQALKDSAKDLLDVVMPDENTPTRVSLVPFATRVNIGVHNTSDYTGRTDINGKRSCPVERKHGANLYEGPPVLGQSEFWVYNHTTNDCPPAKPIMALTDNKQNLITHINGLNAQGATAGHLGVAWSWYTISPMWAGVWGADSAPAAYTDEETVKAIVIMTDGNFTEYHTGGATCNGADDCPESRQEARDLCDAIKANVNADGDEAVTIYTVGFGLDPEGTTSGDLARDTLKHCASFDPKDPEPDPGIRRKLYYFPYDGEAMRQVFKEIGNELRGRQTDLKITK